MREILRKIWESLDSNPKTEFQASIPMLVKILTKAGRILGIAGILRHYKWREVAIAEVLGHRVLAKTSSGKGGDALTPEGKTAEYKTGKISRADFTKSFRRGFLDFGMVYNGAYGEARILPYRHFEHYFGLFDEETEECLLIFRAVTEDIVRMLLENDRARRPGSTTNLNTAKFRVAVGDPRIVYWSSAAEKLRNPA